MTALERIRRIVDALPSDSAAVTLTRRDLAAWLDEDGSVPAPATRDMTVEEVAEEMGRAPSTVRGWLIRGELQGYKLNGRDWRVPRPALRAYLDGQQPSEAPAAGPVDITSWRRIGGAQ